MTENKKGEEVREIRTTAALVAESLARIHERQSANLRILAGVLRDKGADDGSHELNDITVTANASNALTKSLCELRTGIGGAFPIEVAAK